jgi:cell fate regulator YaaT (PSP1 superfamily)
MCCLRYEHEGEEEAPGPPQIGEVVKTPSGQGRIVDIELVSMLATVRLLDGGQEIAISFDELIPEKTARCTDCKGCAIEQLHADAEEAVTA